MQISQFIVVLVACAGFAAHSARAQSCPTVVDTATQQSLSVVAPGVTPAGATWGVAYGSGLYMVGAFNAPLATGMNISAAYGVAIGDYPPVSNDPRGGTCPLVPRFTTHFAGTQGPYPERVVWGGVVDAITGSPLLREVDFELPFGGAVFRHIRTYAEPAPMLMHERERGIARSHTGTPTPSPVQAEIGYARQLASELMWDWAGQGWMIGENPLLLFDAAYEGIGGVRALGASVGAEVGAISAFTQRISYFIPDAHRSIPFERTGGNGGEGDRPTYICPPQFDAAMDVIGGEWDVSGQKWTRWPERVDVWLHGKTVRYSIQLLGAEPAAINSGTGIPSVQIDDQTGEADPLATARSAHNSPGSTASGASGPGLGVPLLGITRRIEDRQGNRIELEYAPLVRDWITLPEGCSIPVEMAERRGQLSQARLYAAGDVEPTWSIVYVHRSFADQSQRWWVDVTPAGGGTMVQHELVYPRGRQNALVGVYVYKGESPITEQGLTIDASSYYAAAANSALSGGLTASLENASGSIEAQAEALRAMNNVEPSEVSTGEGADWVIRQQYLYAEPVNCGTWAATGNPPEEVKWFQRNVFGQNVNAVPGEWGGVGGGYRPAYETEQLPNSDRWVPSADALTTPKLLLSTITDRHAAGAEATQMQRQKMYRYGEPKSHPVAGDLIDRHLLFGVYDGTALEGAVRRVSDMAKHAILIEEPSPIYLDDELYIDAFTVMSLSGECKLINGWDDNGDPLPIATPATGPTVRLYQLPTLRFRRSNLVGGDRHVAPASGGGLVDQHHLGTIMAAAPDLTSGDVLMLGATSVVGVLFPPREGEEASCGVMAARALITPYAGAIAGGVVDDTSSGTGSPSLYGHYKSHSAILAHTLVDNFAENARAVLHRSLVHHPYRTGFVANGSVSVTESPKEHLWFANRESGETGANTPCWALLSTKERKPKSERVTEGESVNTVKLLNAAGLLIREVEVEVKNGVSGGDVTIISTAGDGSSETRDQKGRVTHEFTPGWHAANRASEGDTKGLIRRYGYQSGTDPVLFEPVWGGFQIGTDGPVYLEWAKKYPGVHPNGTIGGVAVGTRFDLVTKEVRYGTPRAIGSWTGSGEPPAADANAGDCEYTYEYTFMSPQGTIIASDPMSGATTSEIVAGATMGSTFNIAAGFHGVFNDGEYNRSETRRLATIKKTILKAPIDGSSLNHFNVEVTSFWPGGSSTKSSGLVPETGGGDGTWRSLNMSAGANTTTIAQSDWIPGGTSAPSSVGGRTVSIQVGDSGRTKVETDAEGRTRMVVTLKDEPEAGRSVRLSYEFDGTTTTLLSPIMREEMRGELVERIDALVATVTNPPAETDLLPAASGVTRLWTKLPRYDNAGRITEMLLCDADGSVLPESPRTEILYNSFAQPVRLKTTAGSIIRTQYDQRGRTERVFRGTNDQHEVWGTQVLSGSACDAAGLYADNLVLVEKRVYGSGVTDAGQLIEKRTFRRRTANQYRLLPDPADPTCVNIPDNDEDAHGIVERTGFDGRMRPVAWTLHPSPTDAATRTEMAWLDNLGRERFRAVFAGAGPTGTIDPRTRDVTGAVPSASDILAASPFTLNETRYDAADRVVETRSYDVSVTAGTGYTRTIRRYGFGDEVTWESGPNGSITQTTYSTTGHPVTRSTFAGSREMTRETYSLDTGNRVIETVALERIDGSTGDALVETGTGGNAIRTRTWNWFDRAGRMIATAELGTEQAGGFVPAAGAGMTRTTADPRLMTSGCLTGFSGAAVPAGAIVSATEYDLEGRVIGQMEAVEVQSGQTVVTSPVTRTTYDVAGRVTLVVENALAASGEQRHTGRQYDSAGRLMEIGVSTAGGPLDWSGLTAGMQKTTFEYGPAVVDADPLSHSFGEQLDKPVTDPDRIAAIHLPDPAISSTSSPTPAYTFQYGPDGKLATRTEGGTGTKLAFTYDERGNRIETRVVDQGVEPVGGWSVDSITAVQQDFDALDRLTASRAYTDIGSFSPGVVAVTASTYDGRGNLVNEEQRHGNQAALSGHVGYTYTFTTANASGANINRLQSIQYPHKDPTDLMSARTSLTIGYGTSGSDDDKLSRVVSLSLGGQPVIGLARSGSGRRVGETLGGSSMTATSYAARQSFVEPSVDGYGYLDGHGRPKLVRYAAPSASAATWERAFARDAAGRATGILVEEVVESLGSMFNETTWLHAYDAFGRLTESKRGAVSGWGVSGGPTFSPSSSIVSLIETHGYDTLGNWLMPSKSKSSLEQTLIENGGSLTVEMAVEPRGDNSVMTIHAQQNQRAVGLDGARRICTDGEFQYVYDFFGRLSEVRRLGTLTVDQDGQLSGGDPGAWIRHFTYDGLGRLIRVQTPFPEPGDDTSVSERRFYDGHRVVQVVKTAPLSLGGAAPVPASFKPLSLEFEGETDEGEGVYRWIDWQLAWDPDGGDRLLCQMRLFSAEDETPRWMYVLSDGHGPPTPWGVLNGEGAVLSRISFTPYGTVLRATMDGSTTWQDAWPVVGYQGLWGTRLDDIGATPWGEWQPSPSGSDGLVAGHQPDAPRHVYDARNRAYMPWLGRWLQPDPLGTGLPVAKHFCAHGQWIYVADNDVSQDDLFLGGMNRYEFVGSSPIENIDPMGLIFSLPDILTTGANMWDMAAGAMNTARGTLRAAFGINASMRAFAMNQMMDFDMIMDWSVPDEALSFHSDNAAMTQEMILGPLYRGMQALGGDDAMPSLPSVWDLLPKSSVARGINSPDPLTGRGEGAVDAFLGRNKVHGAAEHWAGIRQNLLQIAKQDGVILSSIQINRTIIDPETGRPYDLRRPDIQWRTEDGRVHVLEVYHSQHPNDANNKWRRRNPDGTINPDNTHVNPWPAKKAPTLPDRKPKKRR